MGIIHSQTSERVSATPELTLAEVEKRRSLRPGDIGFLRVVPHGVYANLAAHVYKHRGLDTSSTMPVNATVALPDGWQVLMDCAAVNLNKEGYYAVAYVNRAWRHCIIAQRGTSEVMGLRAATWIYFEEPTIQLFLAEQFSKQVQLKLSHEVQNANAEAWYITYTGHSLGAVIATHRALEEGTLAITFESPGCRQFVQKVCSPETQKRLDSSIVTYLQAPNLINSLKPHCGLVIATTAEAESGATKLMFPVAAKKSRETPLPAMSTTPPSEGKSASVAAGGVVPVSVSAAAGRPGFRFRLPSIRPQEYLRDYVLGSVGMGVPEIQQYVNKIEPVLREMLEHTSQIHSIENMRQFFAKDDEPEEEQVVVHWPSHLMQFLEYHNTARALQDPENSAPHVHAAYTAMLRRLCVTQKRDKFRLPLKCLAVEGKRVVELWWSMDARTRLALPLSVIDHKALNVIRIEQDELVTRIITALQAKHYLERLARRPEIDELLRDPRYHPTASHAPAASKL